MKANMASLFILIKFYLDLGSRHRETVLSFLAGFGRITIIQTQKLPRKTEKLVRKTGKKYSEKQKKNYFKKQGEKQ